MSNSIACGHGLTFIDTENVMWDSADEEEKNQYKNITVFHGLEQ